MLCLKNATYVDWRTFQTTRGHLAVTDGPSGEARFVAGPPRGARVLDCSGRIVTKSFVIAHHHLYSALALGMPAPRRAPRGFADMLRLVWWNLDRRLDPGAIRACALAGAVGAAKCGATFIIDHHSSPAAVRGSLRILSDAVEEVGLGHLLCIELSDRDGSGPREEGLRETDRHLGRRPGLVGLHASFTVSDGLLRRAVELARGRGTGLHVHVAEGPEDEARCLRRHGRRVLARFAAAGALQSPKTLLIHGLHLDAAERRLLRESPAWLVQNPESNRDNGVGELDAGGLGDRILLGTDGMHGDMLASARAAYLAGRARGAMTPLQSYRRLRRAHDYLESNGFAGDGSNNLVVLDYRAPTPVTSENWASHLAYGVGAAHVESVIAQGRLVVERRRMTRVDEDEVTGLARREARRLWRRL